MESTVGSLFGLQKLDSGPLEPGGSINPPALFFVGIQPSPSNNLILLIMPALSLKNIEPSTAPTVCKRMSNKLIFLNTKVQEKSEGNRGVLKYSVFW